MLGSYVCRQCRARLNPRLLPSRIPQWQPRATFISLRRKQPQNGAEQTEARRQPDDTDTTHETDQSPSYNLFDRTQTSNQAASDGTRRVGRYSRHLRDSVGDAPETLDAGPPEEVKDVEDAGKAYTVRILGHLRGQGVKDAWALFERTYTSADCEALTKPSTTDIRLINDKRFFSNLLTQVVKDFCQKQGEPAVTPTTALFKYEQLGIAPPGLWIKDAIEPLTHQVMLAANGASTTLQRDLSSLLFELVSVWRLFFQCKGNGNDSLEAISPEWNLPTIDALPQIFQSNDFNYRLQDFHPKSIGSPTLGFCAVYMFNLSDAINSNESLRAQAAPFLDLLARVLAGVRVNSVLNYPAYSKTFQALPQEVQAEIRKEIESAPSRALSMLGQQSSGSDKETIQRAGPSTTDLESFNLKAIARAVEAKTSPVVLEGHWKRILRDYTEGGKTSIPPRIYNAFLSGYLVLRQAGRSVEVWNHMMANGVKPELPTWVAMLEGCEKAKDLDGFNAMWQRMQSAGFEPDNYAWTTRIHGLMSLRQIDLGLRALDEMGNRWRSAETVKNAPPSNSRNSKGARNLPTPAKLVNNCTKPSVEVINGAISGIVQLPKTARISQQKRVDYVQKILRWGTQFDVKPDTRTFNILIQLYLHAGDYATAFKVLKQMELSGLRADISTHTMLITAAFENGTLDNLSEEDQASRLTQMFEDLEAGGLRLNNYVYATAIDRLLKQYDSHTAVRIIIDHMRSRNLSPSAHVYTSLITYYFQQSPPAIEAVDLLLHQIFDSPHSDTDKLFFDRAIEGYAEHGEVGKMMSVLTRMSKNGKHPGFQALTAVIRALVATGDVDRARFIVRDVQRGEGIAYGGVTGAFNDQKQFLAVAQSLGVGLDEERMGDMFRMRNDARMLDEQIKVRMQEEREAIERQPEPNAPEQKTPEQKLEDQWESSPAQREPEQQNHESRDLGPPEEEIHGFLGR
ncbi:hypothetical protein BU25DRAFT_450293 [Macroventuria anomochaeta]|uniref:Uncharacterized protein n=1 Tax=Macroventuria anomochaeta TaxID=301207 RepID=A0ACB6RVD0_9PLEO|nr:uncharacterized protein BU25DRAFT_450293 [Macroventuria anomochaeta]KAF2624847.1 hypothetical protein BU25DRAFT_450293 [Macroventuria anomochaeta]